MVAVGGMHDFRFFIVPFENICADLGVAAFKLVIGGFADIVQEAGPTGEIAIQADHLGDHAGEKGDFDAMPEDILAVARAEMQPAEHVEHFGVHAMGTDFLAASSPFF